MELKHNFNSNTKFHTYIQHRNMPGRDEHDSVMEILNNTLAKEVAISTFYEDERNNPIKEEIDNKRSFRESILRMYEEITWMLRP